MNAAAVAVRFPKVHTSPTPTVLIVEDSMLIKKVLKKWFLSNGCSVTLASDGLEGIALLKRNQYNLVFTDFVMVSGKSTDITYTYVDNLL